MYKIFPLLFAVLLLTACGPKEIGSTYEEPPASSPAVSAEMMRFPMMGANQREKMLYYYNRPDVMQRVQELNRLGYMQRMGINPEDPAYRAVPKQASPFRE